MPKILQFSGLSLDVASSSLRAGDREVELRSKSFEVLRYLAENAGRIVTKEELVEAIWPKAMATDETLAHCVSEVRSAIGDDKHSIIKTVPRRGYRFIAPVFLSDLDSAFAPSEVPAALSRLESSADVQRGLPLPDRPSIAVLPFQNMSGDVEQQYFADGVVEEITTALSRFSGLFVIARNSSFKYRGQAVDVKQIGKELGVRYILEGSVRKAAQRLRITGQLLDAASGTHLWAERFDGAIEDVFDLQDQVAASVAGAIAPKLEQAEIVRAKRKPTDSLIAYDYFLHGMESAYQNTRESVGKALQLFSKTIELDPGFAAGYGMAASCYMLRKSAGWMSDRVREIAEAERLARKAVQLGKDDAVSLSRAANALAFVAHDLDAGTIFTDRALALNPNLAFGWYSSGWLRVWIGDPKTAIKHLAHFQRMSPFDPVMPLAQTGNAFAHFYAGRYNEALAEAEKALQADPSVTAALRVSAAANALGGRIQEAQRMMARLRQIDPELRLSNLKDLTPLRRPEDMARFAEGLGKAGLPE